MITPAPPRLLERLLLLLLAGRDRETISGDLLEEYREEQVERRGKMRADLWYLRQVAGFASIRILGGPQMKQALTFISAAVVVAGVWLGVMEMVLQHPGYPARVMTAACLVLQGAGTLAYLRRQSPSAMRVVLGAGSVALAVLGVVSTARIVRASHFEGFVLLISVALVLQCIFTMAVLFGDRRPYGLHHV